jgi:putative sterol carrier protein
MHAATATPAEILQAIDHRLKNGIPWLRMVTASYLFDITGSRGGLFHLVVREGVGSAGPGGIDNPDVTFRMAADTFMRMKSGTIDDGALAFLNGEVTMHGDQALAISLAPLWFEGVDLTEHT